MRSGPAWRRRPSAVRSSSATTAGSSWRTRRRSCGSTEASTSSLQRTCADGRAWCRHGATGAVPRGIAFLCVVAPNKHTIYPEHLPAWVRRNRTGMSELDQLANELAGERSFLDVRPVLLAAKGSNPTRSTRRSIHTGTGSAPSMPTRRSWTAVRHHAAHGDGATRRPRRGSRRREGCGPGQDAGPSVGHSVEDYVWVRAR